MQRPAAAQEQSTEFPSWRVPGWSFTPGIVFGALYDTNVAIASPDVERTVPMIELAIPWLLRRCCALA